MVVKSLSAKAVAASSTALANNSTVSPAVFTVGKSTTISAIAAGGTGSYTYKIEYKRTTATSYTTASTSNKFVFKPGSAGAFDVRVTVKDSAGTSVVKNFTVVAN